MLFWHDEEQQQPHTAQPFKTVFDRNKVYTMHVSLTFESVYDSEYETV